MERIFFKTLFFCFLCILSYSCTRDNIEPISEDCVDIFTYEIHVKPIVNSSCAYNGCHSGAAPGDFSTYSGLSSIFNNGKFHKRVLNEKSMPPPEATEGPTELSEEQYHILFCWAESGFIEN